MALLTRDAVLAAKDFTTKDVDVPEWGGMLRVRGLSGRERSALEKMFGLGKETGNVTRPVAFNPRDPANAGEPTWLNWRMWLIAVATVDENMGAVFTPTDIEALGRRSAAPLDRLANAVMELSGLSEKERREMEGNSGATTIDDGSSP